MPLPAAVVQVEDVKDELYLDLLMYLLCIFYISVCCTHTYTGVTLPVSRHGIGEHGGGILTHMYHLGTGLQAALKYEYNATILHLDEYDTR